MFYLTDPVISIEPEVRRGRMQVAYTIRAIHGITLEEFN